MITVEEQIKEAAHMKMTEKEILSVFDQGSKEVVKLVEGLLDVIERLNKSTAKKQGFNIFDALSSAFDSNPLLNF